MTRDGPVFAEDEFRIALDPNLTRRNGYEFEVGAAGAHEDGLIQNNSNDLTRWNTIWRMRTRIVADGWVAEIEIPFRDLSYDPSRSEWGFDFVRQIRHKTERVRWATQNPAIPNDDISQEGVLTGIAGTNVGIGLDVKVYGRLSFKKDWQPAARDAFSGTAGVVANYKLAQALTLTGTLNPDFSDSPLDDRQVNTTRFSLFIPESRDFFLQDAPSFEFGGLAFVTPFVDAPNAQPFFSRNIGLIRGTPVTILGGAKLSGEYDDIGVGALFAHTNRKLNTPAQDLSVLRMTEPVLGQSKVGFIVTNGDPTGLTRNTLAGADFQYLDSHFIANKILQGSLYYQRSFSSSLGDDASFGGVVNFPNEPWAGELIYRQVGENFAPALGYLNAIATRTCAGSCTARRVSTSPASTIRSNQVRSGCGARSNRNARIPSISMSTIIMRPSRRRSVWRRAIRWLSAPRAACRCFREAMIGPMSSRRSSPRGRGGGRSTGWSNAAASTTAAT